MSLVQSQHEFLHDVVELLSEAWSKGFIVTGGELYRTAEQQQIYLDKGLSKTLNSRHLQRLAIDFNFFKIGLDHRLELVETKPKLQGLGDYWEALDSHNKWGGNFLSFPDLGHFERGPNDV